MTSPSAIFSLFRWQKIVQFIETKGPVKPDGSRIGLVEFSSPSQTHVVFGLTSSHLYELEVENALGSVGYDKGNYRCQLMVTLIIVQFCT